VEDARAELRKRAATVPRWLGHLEQQLARNGGDHGFVVGDTPSIADIALWHLLEAVHDNGMRAALDDFPLLLTFFARFGERPGIAAYRTSARRHPPQLFPT
jgi:glutathione S-transferase